MAEADQFDQVCLPFHLLIEPVMHFNSSSIEISSQCLSGRNAVCVKIPIFNENVPYWCRFGAQFPVAPPVNLIGTVQYRILHHFNVEFPFGYGNWSVTVAFSLVVHQFLVPKVFQNMLYIKISWFTTTFEEERPVGL